MDVIVVNYVTRYSALGYGEHSTWLCWLPISPTRFRYAISDFCKMGKINCPRRKVATTIVAEALHRRQRNGTETQSIYLMIKIIAFQTYSIGKPLLCFVGWNWNKHKFDESIDSTYIYVLTECPMLLIGLFPLCPRMRIESKFGQ